MPHTLLVNEKKPDCDCFLVQEICSKIISLLNGGFFLLFNMFLHITLI